MAEQRSHVKSMTIGAESPLAVALAVSVAPTVAVPAILGDGDDRVGLRRMRREQRQHCCERSRAP